MNDPFAPKSVIVPKLDKSRLEHSPVARLRRIGASRLVVGEMQARWSALSTAERHHAAVDLAAMSDDELRNHVLEMEVELVGGSVVDQKTSDGAVAILRTPDDVPRRTVKDAEQWVGDKPERALAALVLELREPPTEQRSTLIDALQKALHGG